MEAARAKWTDDRIDDLSDRLTAFEARVEVRFDGVESRIDSRFDAFEARQDERFERLEASIDARFDRKEAQIERLTQRVDRIERTRREEKDRALDRWMYALIVLTWGTVIATIAIAAIAASAA